MSKARTRDDLPQPREPVINALFAGRPAKNCSVLATNRCFWSSISRKALKRMADTLGTATNAPVPLRLLTTQRQASADQPGSCESAGGKIASNRPSTDSARSNKIANATAPDRFSLGILVPVV